MKLLGAIILILLAVAAFLLLWAGRHYKPDWSWCLVLGLGIFSIITAVRLLS